MRAAANYGVAITEPGRGSHWQCRRAGCRMYTIPAHGGPKTEISDKYIAAFCKHFGIDLEAFKREL